MAELRAMEAGHGGAVACRDDLDVTAGENKTQIVLRDRSHSTGESHIKKHPLRLGSITMKEGALDGPVWPYSATSTQFNDSPMDRKLSFPLNVPKSFLSHRRDVISVESLPQDNAARALVSQPSYADAATISMAEQLSARLSQGNVLPEQLTMALQDLNAKLRTPSTAKFSSLRSPCFFHQRFDDAVNIERVLEEVAAEDNGMSSSRLIQTATSVREISKQLSRRPIKRAVRTVMIVTKARDNSLVHLTRDIAQWLMTTPRYNSDIGVTVYVDAKLRSSKRFDAPGLLAEDSRFEKKLQYWGTDLCYTSPELFDLVLTLGGDGTVLFTSGLFQRVVPPILAFSLGSLGFLTNFEYTNYKNSLNNVMGEAGMRVNLRMRFTCTIFRSNLNRTRSTKTSPVDTSEMVQAEQFEVLNELVIDRGPSSYVSNLELYGDDELLTVVAADGCIISTPTGSTAYSLSAGGPLVHPSIPGIALTPICPHTLSFRPMVLSDSLMLKVCVPRKSRSTAYVSFDGKGRVELRRGDFVQVEAGRYPFPTVVGAGGTGGEWFESVRRALRWNTRGAMQKSFHASSKKAAKGKSETPSGDAPEEDEEEEEEEEDENEEWDINPDPVEVFSANDSGVGASVFSSKSVSPQTKQSSFSF